jgi:(S)-3,5-dihydroxyphenylglycine transaminase
VIDAAGARSLFADELSKIKSMLTVNTSPIAQAVVGGKLLENGCSLLAANERERAVYAHNMRLMVEGLAARFPDPELGVRFNVPAGGFFVVVTVPFPVDDSLLERSAADYGVLWTSMHHFYEPGVPVNALRLSCSTVTPEQIDTGLDRLARLINDQLRGS